MKKNICLKLYRPFLDDVKRDIHLCSLQIKRKIVVSSSSCEKVELDFRYEPSSQLSKFISTEQCKSTVHLQSKMKRKEKKRVVPSRMFFRSCYSAIVEWEKRVYWFVSKMIHFSAAVLSRQLESIFETKLLWLITNKWSYRSMIL